MSEFKNESDVLKVIKDKEIKFIDLRFTDLRGKEQHITITASQVDGDFFRDGKMIDGSSIAGWRSINMSDMVIRPVPETAVIDPFFQEPTLIIQCDIYEPSTMTPYNRDPRYVARRAEEYLQSTGIADVCYVGPEPEFFILDDVRYSTRSMEKIGFEIDSREAAWNSQTDYNSGNTGHRPQVKGGYFPVPPVDSSHDLRSTMCLTLGEMGQEVEVHHHEVATGNQCEIGVRFNTLLKKADELQRMKYVIHNVADMYGKTATFMPKPLVDDNGNGMHCHQSLFKGGGNIFSGDMYAGLSETALYYIGGIIKHARALNAFTNASTNSYKRLVPGFEAPVHLAYSACNRSAAIRVPYVTSPKARRIEVRFPDPTANPYLSFAAMMMAGLDGIKNKIHPGEPMDKNLYDLPPEEMTDVDSVCATLDEALQCLENDAEFLLEGDVFTDDLIKSYTELKRAEVQRLRTVTHPVEFEMYYSC